MPYIDQTPRRRLFLLLPVCFALCYLVNIWVVELRSNREALLGTAAREMAASRDFLRTTFQGEPVNLFPQYPIWVALCSGMGTPNTVTTRLPASLAVLATSIVCGLLVARRQGRTGGIVTACIVLSNLACMRSGQRAQTETLHMLWMTCAWVSWYVFGQERKRWGLAWGLAMFFVFLGATTVGARALAYFYVPFLLLKRPVRGRRRLLQPYHLVALMGLTLGILLWLWAAPGQPFMPWNVERVRSVQNGGYTYSKLVFLAKAAFYLMPWTAMVWTPFCVSFRPVERSSVFFHFFRAQVVSLFFVIWVLPNTSPLDLLPILPALAILSGAHFEILMRRHKWHLERYLSLLAWLALIVSSGCLLLGALHVLGVVPMVGFSSLVLAWNAGILAVVALFATLALRSRKENGLPYWFRFMIAVCALRLIVAAVNAPLEAWVGNERRQVAMVLAGKMPAADLHGGNGPMSPDLRPVDLPTPNVLPGSGATIGDSVPPPNYRAIQPRLGLPEDVKTVYVYRPPLVTESFYLGCMTIRVTDLARDLPSTEPVVYVLGGAQAPILPSRIWTPVSPVLDSHRRNDLFWSWVLADGCLLEFRVVPRPESPDYRPNPICLYRGELR